MRSSGALAVCVLLAIAAQSDAAAITDAEVLVYGGAKAGVHGANKIAFTLPSGLTVGQKIRVAFQDSEEIDGFAAELIDRFGTALL